MINRLGIMSVLVALACACGETESSGLGVGSAGEAGASGTSGTSGATGGTGNNEGGTSGESGTSGTSGTGAGGTGAGGSGGASGAGGSGGSGGQLPSDLWWKHLSANGVSGASYVRDTTVVFDHHDNLIIAGLSLGAVTFDPPGNATGQAPRALFLAKYSPSGQQLWAKQFGTCGQYSHVRGLAIGDNDEIYLTGEFKDGPFNLGGGDLVSAGATDVFIGALNKDGEHLWSLARGAQDWDFGGAIALDHDGHLVSAFVAGGRLSLISLTLSGEVVFERQTEAFLSTNESFASAVSGVTTAISGDIYVTGRSTLSGVDFGGGPLPPSQLEGAFVASYAHSDGAYRWARGLVTSLGNTVSNEGLRATGIISQGEDVVAFGSFPGTVDFGGGPRTAGDEFSQYSGYVVRYAADGAHQWSYGMSDASIDGSTSDVQGISRDPSGAVVMTAYWNKRASFDGTPFDGEGYSLVLLSPSSGHAISATPLSNVPTPNVSLAGAAVRDSQGHTAFAMEFSGEQSFPFTTLTSSGQTDTVLVWY